MDILRRTWRFEITKPKKHNHQFKNWIDGSNRRINIDIEFMNQNRSKENSKIEACKDKRMENTDLKRHRGRVAKV